MSLKPMIQSTPFLIARVIDDESKFILKKWVCLLDQDNTEASGLQIYRLQSCVHPEVTDIAINA